MRRIFQNVKQTTSANAASDKDLKGCIINVSGLPVTIESKIAEGGFSFVYVVRCHKTNRLYALKRQFVNEARLLEACKREIEITRTLGSHPNIVTYVASSLKQAPDGIFEYLLLTHYYKNSVLQMMNERLAAGKYLALAEILSIFCDVCCAVARLHHCQTPVVHRDLKVENLLLENISGKEKHSSKRCSPLPSCVLCDFGSATTRHVTPSQSQQPISAIEDEIARFTTLSYRSPEMVDLYSGHAITTKADIWALGVMLFKLCYFTLPFGESTLAIQSATFNFPPEPQFPQELLALIVYMLTPDPNQRPDIYQVATVAFAIASRDCPVKNLNDCEPIKMSSLRSLLLKHSCRSRGMPAAQAAATSGAVSLASAATNKTPPGVAPESGATPTSDKVSLATVSLSSGIDVNSSGAPKLKSMTSVVPRQRPRVQPVASPAALSLVNAENAIGPWKTKCVSPVSTKDRVICSQSLKDNISISDSSRVNVPLREAANLESNEQDSKMNAESVDAASLTTRNSVDGQQSCHRRNISDPSAAINEMQRCSAFRPYHSQQQVYSSANAKEHRLSSASSSTNQLQEENDGQKSSKVPPTILSPSWNPFDLDDHVFGLHFDELPRKRGSNSSIANVKSRESLVMEDSDPFGAAPFAAPLSPNQKTSSNAAAMADKLIKTKRLSKYEKLVNHPEELEQAADKMSTLQPPKVSSVSARRKRQQRKTQAAVDPGLNPYSDELNHNSSPAVTMTGTIVKYRPHFESDQMGRLEVDSVGSASDLQARMQASSSTEEDSSDEDADEAGQVKAASSPDLERKSDDGGSSREEAVDNSSYEYEMDDRPTHSSRAASNLDDSEVVDCLLETDPLSGRRPLLLDDDVDDERSPASGVVVGSSGANGAAVVVVNADDHWKLSTSGGGGGVDVVRRPATRDTDPAPASSAAPDGRSSPDANVFSNAPYDDQAALMTSSPKRQPVRSDALLNKDHHTNSYRSCQTQSQGVNALKLTVIANHKIDQQPIKKSAFVNNSFQGDDIFRS